MEQNLMDIYNRVNEFGRDHQMSYEVIKPGHIVYTFTPGARHLATPVVVHGGMIAAFMDAVISVAGLSAVHHENRLVATIEFKINYTAPSEAGSTLTGTGQVIHQTGSTLVVSGEIVNAQGKLVATALGTLKAYPYPGF